MTKQYRFGNVCGDKGLVAPNDEWLIENVNSITDLEKNWDTVLDVLNEQHETIMEQDGTIQGLRSMNSILEASRKQTEEVLQKHYDRLNKIVKSFGNQHKPCLDEIKQIADELGVDLDG